MGEVGAIEKSRRGDGIGYKFRGIDDIYSALQPLLSKHGVFFCPKVVDQKREERATKSGGMLTFTILKMSFTFYAEDGSNIEVTTVGEAMDTSDKSSNKAMSAALKYATLQLFCIPTEEEKDTEYQNHEPAPRESHERDPLAGPSNEKMASEPQRKMLYAVSSSAKIPDDEVKRIMSTFGYQSSKEIRAKDVNPIKKKLEEWRPKQ